jgi:hypothetical protein
MPNVNAIDHVNLIISQYVSTYAAKAADDIHMYN